MASESRRSLIARIWASGAIQAATPDVFVLIGLTLIGVGIWQWSRPATLVYTGAMIVVACVLSERARPTRRGGTE